MNQSPLSQQTKATPAWLLSLVFHAFAITFLAVVVGLRVPPTGIEKGREVAIVLATPASDAVAYSDGTESATRSDDEVISESSSADAAALPAVDTAASFELSELALPNAPAGLEMTDSGLVPSVNTAGGRRTSVPTGLDHAAIAAERDALRRAKAARGPVTQVQLFGGAPAEGRSFVFLIDRSKSMGSQGLGALEAAEAEMRIALQRLTPRHQFQVVAYHHQCVYLQKRKLLPASEENKQQIDGFLGGLAAFGATEHERALMSAMHLEPDVIYLLTDGGDPYLNDGQLRRISSLAAGRTAIHCVHFGFGPPRDADHFLRRLAALNSGGYRYVDMHSR